MKKLTVFTLIIVMIGTGLLLSVYAQTDIKVLFNGTEIKLDQNLIKQNDRVLVPMRKIFEELGAGIVWEEGTQTVFSVKDDFSITLQAGNPIMQKNGESIELDVPPCLVSGQLLVPLRAVAEGLGLEVWWIEETQTVVLEKYFNQMSVNKNYNIRRLLEPSETRKYFIHRFNDMIRFGEKDKYGYIDVITGQMIPAVYESAFDFDGGSAIVQSDGYYGVIDKTNTIIIPFEYNRIYSFGNNGAAVVSKMVDGVEKWGKIDKSGKIVVPIEYDSEQELQTGLVIITQGNYMGINKSNGETVVPLSDCQITKNCYGIGYEIAVYSKETNRKQVKYCNVDGDGMAVVSDLYDAIYPHYDGMARVEKGDKFGFIDTSGRLTIPLIYEEAETFSQGLAFVRKNGKWGFINTAGETVIDFQYDGDPVKISTKGYYSAWESKFGNGFAKVRQGDHFGIVNKNGDIVIPIEYDDIKDDYGFKFLSEYGIIPVKKNGLWGIADVNGNLLVDCTCVWIDSFSDGYAFFAEGEICDPSHTFYSTNYLADTGNYGILSITGEIMARDIPLDPMYVYHRSGVDGGSFSGGEHVNRPAQFHEGLAAAHDENGKWGYIDPMGQIVIEPQFDTITQNGERIGRMPGGGTFKNGFAKVYINGAYNIIDKQGNLMLDRGWESIKQSWESNALNGDISESDEYFICENSAGDLQILTRDCESVLFSEKGILHDKDGGFMLLYDPLSVCHIRNGIFLYEQGRQEGLFSVQAVEQSIPSTK